MASPATATGNKRGLPRKGGARLLVALVALFWLAVVLIPISYAVIQTFKTQADALASSPWSLNAPTLENYQTVLGPQILRYLLNSVVTSVGAVVLSTLLASLAAYALARLPHRANGFLYLLFVSGLAVPIYASIIPI